MVKVLDYCSPSTTHIKNLSFEKKPNIIYTVGEWNFSLQPETNSGFNIKLHLQVVNQGNFPWQIQSLFSKQINSAIRLESVF